MRHRHSTLISWAHQYLGGVQVLVRHTTPSKINMNDDPMVKGPGGFE